MMRNATVTVNGSTNQAFCTGCWLGVAMESLKIELETASHEPVHVRDRFYTNLVFGPHLPGSIADFSPGPREILARNEPVTAAYVLFLVKTNQMKDVYPVCISYFWSPDHGRWLPLDFCVGMNHETVRYIY
jgi:hypothetical protein